MVGLHQLLAVVAVVEVEVLLQELRHRRTTRLNSAPVKSVPRTYLEHDAFCRGVAGHLRHRWHQAGRGRVVIVVKGDHLGQFGAVLSATEG